MALIYCIIVIIILFFTKIRFPFCSFKYYHHI
nr:MAG TPA: hypothetical protein [Caudoviricetes sp.]